MENEWQPGFSFVGTGNAEERGRFLNMSKDDGDGTGYDGIGIGLGGETNAGRTIRRTRIQIKRSG